MNRIDQIFQNHRSNGSKALMPFITAGHPSLPATAAILPKLHDAGASICEIGIPFSDPIADGPVIQASMTHALNQNITLEQTFDTIRKLRPTLDLGLVAMLSFSIVFRVGVDRFIADAADAGFDGLILPDLPIEQADLIAKPAADAGLTTSYLIAPTTPDDRALEIAKACTGFVYVVSRTGITGARTELPPDLLDRLQKIRSVTDLPITVGFGISSPDHVSAVTSIADAAIVGSALVSHIDSLADQSTDTIADSTASFVANLATGLQH